MDDRGTRRSSGVAAGPAAAAAKAEGETRILLVEDNPADARLLVELISEEKNSNVHLERAATLHAALDRLAEAPFDVILLDLTLPDGEGLETLAQVHSSAPSVPIVVLTGLDDEDLALRAIREGAQDYLLKGRMDGLPLLRILHYATERKRATDALKRSEGYFRSLIENARDVIVVLNEDATLRYASPSIAAVLGLDPSQMVGTSLAGRLHPEESEAVRGTFERLWRNPSSTETAEFRVRHASGDWRTVEVVGKNLLDDPSVEGVVINFRDVTEKRQAEEEVRRVNQTLEALIQTSPLAIVSTDLEGRVQSCNQAAERIFGRSANDLLGRTIPGLSSSAAEDWRKLRDMGAPGHMEARAGRPNATEVDLSIWTAALLSASGTPAGYVSVIEDITESKRLEEQLRQAQKMEAVGRLAGGIAHDFNNLLTVITGYCQLSCHRLPPSDPVRNDLETALKAAERATTLTKQLLAFSRRQLVSPKVIDLNRVVRELQGMLRGVLTEEIELEVNTKTLNNRVMADPAQLELVLLNMSLNSRDAMPLGGRLTIEISDVHLDQFFEPVDAEDGGRHYVRLSVSDTGRGMSPEVQSRLFEPFFTTKPRGQGTGLGLSTSYGIVKQHGGEIRVKSTPGAGSRFDIYLPAVEGVAAPQAAPPVIGSPRGAETILLVEDEFAVRQVVQEMLKRNGYTVLSAGDPEEGLKIAQSHPSGISLLISDLVMPKMTGTELGERVLAARPGIRVLYISGYTERHVATRVASSGAAFLQKPFTPQALALRVRQLLDGESA